MKKIVVIFLLTLCMCSKLLADEKISLRNKWIVTTMSNGPVAAKHKGFFKEQGLEVKILPGGFELDPTKMVVAGVDTFGVTGADILMMAREKGVPLVAIGVEYQRSPIVFISRADSGITHPRDFVGKKVGCKLGTPNQTIYEAMLKKLGVDREKITEVTMRWSILPFLHGEVDVMSGYIVNEPLEIRDEGIDINIMEPNDFQINFVGNVYFTTEETIKNRPDLVKKFMTAVIDGWNYTFRHRQEAVDLAIRENPDLKKEKEYRVYDIMLPYFTSSNGRFCWFNRKSWQETHDILLSLGLLSKPLDLSEVYTDKFVKEVYQ